MIARKLVAAAAASLTAAVLVTGAAAAVAQASSYTVQNYWGTGSTLAAAKASALQYSVEDGCASIGTLLYRSESAQGIWTAEVQVRCPNPN